MSGIDYTPYISTTPQGHNRMHVIVSGIHCPGCVRTIEQGLSRVPGVKNARVNLTTRRMVLEWQPEQTTPHQLVAVADNLGYPLQPYEPELLERADRKAERHLLLCLAVAGFASMNVMLLSVALWSGAHEMNLTTRVALQWFSSLIVLPSVAYAGQPFFRSAWQALKHRRLNMDVPISLAVILTTMLSLSDTILRTGETYFESAAMLLFFLLAGRYLDTRARSRNRSAAEQLLSLQSRTVKVVGPRGTTQEIPARALTVGQTILVSRGEHIPVDGTIIQGKSQIDVSLLTGESLPQAVTPGSTVSAGCLNLETPVHIRVTAVGSQTALAQLAKLVEEATASKNRYTRLADRVVRPYAPLVHTLALSTFTGWYVFGHATFHQSLLNAAAVLIVTCPCALALAVPAVQVALVSRLLRRGIILKAPDALERLTDVKAVVFDKTGTLTTGHLQLVGTPPKAALALAARLAQTSHHPLARALAAAVPEAKPLPEVAEHPGEGLSATYKGQKLRLGSRTFCKIKNAPEIPPGHTELWFTAGKAEPVRFLLADTLKPNARQAVEACRTLGLTPYLLSGDNAQTAAAIAQQVGIPNAPNALGNQSPATKHDFLKKLAQNGTPALMCGDGINDAPSLAAAHASLTFGAASDIAKTSADLILQSGSLTHIPALLKLARTGRRAVIANFGVSFAYNVVTVPMAMAGLITPLWAALAMSASSLMVVLNALRLAHTPTGEEI